MPVNAAEGIDRFSLTVTSQGLCGHGHLLSAHPQSTEISLTGSAASAGEGGFLSRALGEPAPADRPARLAPTPAGATAPAATGADDESASIARLLGEQSLPLMLFVLFGFGLLLAFTPCTFPMIPILVGHHRRPRRPHLAPGHSRCRSPTCWAWRSPTRSRAWRPALRHAALGGAAERLGAGQLRRGVRAAGAVDVRFLRAATAKRAAEPPERYTANHGRAAASAASVVMGALSALIVGPCVAAPLAGALLYIAQTGDAWRWAARRFS